MAVLSPVRTDYSTLFAERRSRTEELCAPLEIEDYVVQPVAHVSPPKWHLAHSSWFFEEFLLGEMDDYQPHHPDYSYLFNSYYESVGDRVLRPNRGNLSRPTVEEIYDYRASVDRYMKELLDGSLSKKQKILLEVGLNHEQQHQELLLTDIKYILGHNPLWPAYETIDDSPRYGERMHFISMEEGLYEIGFEGSDFSYDNERPRHKVYLQPYEIADRPVTNGEFLHFMLDDGYDRFELWHKDGREWVRENDVSAPLYWHYIDGAWHEYTLNGLEKLDPERPVKHISYYEAFAYAQWREMRLPTEFEWEAAQNQFAWGDRWECTESSHLPYPGYEKPSGAIGEYNGKFMVNQKVFRGSSVATPPGHERPTYRNYFQPWYRWQFTGIRLVK